VRADRPQRRCRRHRRPSGDRPTRSSTCTATAVAARLDGPHRPRTRTRDPGRPRVTRRARPTRIPPGIRPSAPAKRPPARAPGYRVSASTAVLLNQRLSVRRVARTVFRARPREDGADGNCPPARSYHPALHVTTDVRHETASRASAAASTEFAPYASHALRVDFDEPARGTHARASALRRRATEPATFGRERRRNPSAVSFDPSTAILAEGGRSSFEGGKLRR